MERVPNLPSCSIGGAAQKDRDQVWSRLMETNAASVNSLRAADFVAGHTVDALRKLLDLAGGAALGDAGGVRDPGAGFVDEGIFFRVFQDDESFAIDNRSLTPDELWWSAKAARVGGSRGWETAFFLAVIGAIPGHFSVP
jgi:hypothetical protein